LNPRLPVTIVGALKNSHNSQSAIGPKLRLCVDRLSKAYNFLWALRDFSVELESGDLVALLGPNGAGKTTLLKLLVGLIAPTSGSIRFDGFDLLDVPDETLRDLRVAEIVEQDMVLKNGKVEAYRAKVKVSFKFEGKG